MSKETKEPTEGKKAKEKPKKSIVQNLLNKFEQWKANKELKQEELKSTSSKTKTQKTKINKNYYYNPYNWVRKIFFWSNIQVFLILIATLLVWSVLYFIRERELVVIDIPKNIQQQVFGFFKQNDPDRDALENFVISRLTIMRSFDYNGQPNLYLLQGSVSPDILQAIQTSFSNQRQQIVEQGLIQVLAPPVVETVFLEELTNTNPNQMARRAEVYVSGYLVVTRVQGRGGVSTRVIPYRAQLSVVSTPVSRLNRHGFYITQITEVSGEDNVRRFDTMLRAERERRGR